MLTNYGVSTEPFIGKPLLDQNHQVWLPLKRLRAKSGATRVAVMFTMSGTFFGYIKTIYFFSLYFCSHYRQGAKPRAILHLGIRTEELSQWSVRCAGSQWNVKNDNAAMLVSCHSFEL